MKKAYKQGEIKRVKLVPEEAVLLSCKSHAAGGPADYHGMCHDALGVFCSAMGS